MTLDEISAAVQAFRDGEMAKIHQTVNNVPNWRKDEVMTAELRRLDHRAARYAASLGAADEDEHQAAPATVAAVTPGSKAKG